MTLNKKFGIQTNHTPSRPLSGYVAQSVKLASQNNSSKDHNSTSIPPTTQNETNIMKHYGIQHPTNVRIHY
jgi:hypothetical protein